MGRSQRHQLVVAAESPDKVGKVPIDLGELWFAGEAS